MLNYLFLTFLFLLIFLDLEKSFKWNPPSDKRAKEIENLKKKHELLAVHPFFDNIVSPIDLSIPNIRQEENEINYIEGKDGIGNS